MPEIDINAVKDLIEEQNKRTSPPPADKEYYLFSEGRNAKKAFHRVANPSVRLQKELDRLRMKRDMPKEAKEQICKEMGFDMSEASEDLSELEYLEKALPIVMLDLPSKWNVDDLSSLVAKEAIADFLRCT